MTPNLLLPSSTGVAKVLQTSRRYRGLYLVVPDPPTPAPLRTASLQQTQAIVAQVGREIAQQAAREGLRPRPSLVPKSDLAEPNRARRFVLSLLPGSF